MANFGKTRTTIGSDKRLIKIWSTLTLTKTHLLYKTPNKWVKVKVNIPPLLCMVVSNTCPYNRKMKKLIKNSKSKKFNMDYKIMVIKDNLTSTTGKIWTNLKTWAGPLAIKQCLYPNNPCQMLVGKETTESISLIEPEYIFFINFYK